MRLASNVVKRLYALADLNNQAIKNESALSGISQGIFVTSRLNTH